ncbi:MAG: hypothetical protein Q8Q88_23945 [Phenylobacterium sp.]|uniref:hypothetical protein n=1 Tax=Phenylobacterium sp. TaxID=1871053 RepID=UPI0027341D09|nr:hypothetical protein [Phenylobacterium sp.]MDP3750089.1 hypothetical protein [Phenylobacterium sp.]
MDLADFVLKVIRPREDAAILFEGSHTAPAKPDLSGLTATQRLDHANAGGKPVTSL